MLLDTKVKNAPPTGGHVFQATGTNFKLVQNIIGTNLLTKFHDDHTINMASRVLNGTKCPAPWWPYIIRTNLLTKFHEDRKINLAARVLTRKKCPAPWRPYRTINVASRGKCPAPWQPVFQANVTIFELIQDIIEINILTKFHEDWTINVASREFTRKNAPPLGSHVFQANHNLLTKFHEDWTINVASRELTRFYYRHLWKTAPPPGGHTNILTKIHEDWVSNVTSTVFTSFELSRGINGTNVLTKFHEDQTINVASRVFTRQNVDDGRRTTDKRRSQKLTMSTLCSGELKLHELEH
ncbi:hypothetical protein DPMN_005325 [Dreissena polymorpha]|uniref:Uncharacterized protein n=1 Tax=Dreissena polymorpha TaxID=45954 RepID=A0A9D4RUB3_DREPO|nr:hypothetical protein DPMN_005325 [Dreissena polymorpha]